jgi:hypothetical protein
MGTTEITYTSTEGDARTTKHTSGHDAWATLNAWGRMVPELGAEIDAAAATGYSLQTHTFRALRDGVSHTVSVVDTDTHTSDGEPITWELESHTIIGDQEATEIGYVADRSTPTGRRMVRARSAAYEYDYVSGVGAFVRTGERTTAVTVSDADAAAKRERRHRMYATRRPAIERSFPENVVTQGDADYCRDFGHVYYIVDGVDTGTCPRCGNVTPEVYDAGRAIPRGTVVEYLHIATRTWKRATVESFRASDAAYVLRTEHGTDAAPARHVHTLPATESDATPCTAFGKGCGGTLDADGVCTSCHAVCRTDAAPQGPQCAACGDATCTAPDAHHTVTERQTDGDDVTPVETGQVWVSHRYSTRHTIVGPADADGWWDARGPLGHLYAIDEATLRRSYHPETSDAERGEIDNDVASFIGLAIVGGGLATWFLTGIIPALLGS